MNTALMVAGSKIEDTQELQKWCWQQQQKSVITAAFLIYIKSSNKEHNKPKLSPIWKALV